MPHEAPFNWFECRHFSRYMCFKMSGNCSDARTSNRKWRSTDGSSYSPHLHMMNALKINCWLVTDRHTIPNAKTQPSGPAWAKAFPLERKRPVPIMPARAIIDRLYKESQHQNQATEYDDCDVLPLLETRFNVSISCRVWMWELTKSSRVMGEIWKLSLSCWQRLIGWTVDGKHLSASAGDDGGS